MINKQEIDILAKKYLADPDFASEIKAHPAETIEKSLQEAEGADFRLDDETRQLISEVNWQSQSLGRELQERLSKSTIDTGLTLDSSGGDAGAATDSDSALLSGSGSLDSSSCETTTCDPYTADSTDTSTTETDNLNPASFSDNPDDDGST